MGCTVSVESEPPAARSTTSGSKSTSSSSAGGGGSSARSNGSHSSSSNSSSSNTTASHSTAGSVKEHHHQHQQGLNRQTRRMRLKELREATENFSESRVLGEGSFGQVYRGEIRNKDGTVERVAVKKLNKDSFQGSDEWIAEVLTLEKVQHPFLVNLIGYSSDGGEAHLVYELYEGGSLEDWLFEDENPDKLLNWKQRVRLAQELAEALEHLHRNKIIHRDLKPANVLLTQDLSTRLTDFGLAKEAADGQSHVSTRVMGTMGYLDPSYLETGQLRDNSDVYSFGVILLELVTGKRAISAGGKSMLQWVRPFLAEDKPDVKPIIDPRLGRNWSRHDAMSMVIVAKHAMNPNFDERPSMKSIVGHLQKLSSK